MSEQHPLLRVIGPVRQYLRGELPAHRLVQIIDELVSHNILSELEPAAADLVDKLQLALALYTPDERTRLEEPTAMIGRDQLLKRVSNFDNEIRRLGFSE